MDRSNAHARKRVCRAQRSERFFASAMNLGSWRQVFQHLAPFDSMMTHCSDPREAPGAIVVARTDAGIGDFTIISVPTAMRRARKPQIGTYTPVLGSDGSDLAAAMQTIREIGNARELDEGRLPTLSPAAKSKSPTATAFSELQMSQHGLLRCLKAAELSRRHAAISASGRRAFRRHRGRRR